MIVSLNWLRSYVDIALSVEELVHRLTMAGLEVEAVQRRYPFLEGVVTARVESVESHPRADRLHICKVSDGHATYKVVCGAPNVAEGAVIALALPGAQVAGGMVIQETRIRGEHSQGMICSQSELGVGDDASGIWILPEETAVGVPLREALNQDDFIIEISITPNRGDCLSMLGIAREIAAIGGTGLHYPVTRIHESRPSINELTSITIEDPVGCPRYAARIVQGIKVGPSPDWLKERLEAVGIRSISNIVDVTNFVMMEMGQPLHAFDFDRLRQHRIVVRRATEGQKFTTLDGVERTLFDDTLLICDGEGPVAIAGIMGGLDSEIEQDTTTVLIESAYFQPQCIRRSSKKLGLRSESSYRFERGIDPEGVIRALDRAAQLMSELAGGEVREGYVDVYPNPIEIPELILRVDRTNDFLGMELDASDMASALKSIEMQVEELDGKTLRVVPPSFRSDVTREVDLQEEIARLIGYDKIPVTTPKSAVESASLDPHLRTRTEVKSLFEAAGFYEIITYSFIPADALKKLRLAPADIRLSPVCLRNPLSEDQAVMRTTLIPGILQVARHNLDRRNNDLKIFELSKVFLQEEGSVLPEEPHHLAGLMTGRRYPDPLYGSEEEVDYTDLKGAVEGALEPFFIERLDYVAKNLPPYFAAQCGASIYCRGIYLGALGKLGENVAEAFDIKKSIYLFELDFERLLEVSRPHPFYRPLPKFPSVSRDMALVVDENLPVQEPLDFIWSQQESLLENVEVFDIYRNPHLGNDKKSLGYRLVYRAPDRSLTDEEVNSIHGGLVAKVLTAFDATLR